MHYASFDGRFEIVNDLLNFGADVNILDQFGNPPLRAAIQSNREDVEKLLRENGGEYTEE